MSSNSFLTSIPKLKGRENYREWAFAVENLLILEGAENSIKIEPTAEAAASDAKAKAKLILTIDPSLYVHIKEATSANSLWQKLKTMFDDSGFARRISLLRNLISIRLDSCESMTNYVTQIIETGQKLSGTGFSVNDEWIGCLMLAGLPEKYMPMLMAIEHSGIAITADVIKTKLIDLAGDDCDVGNAFFSKGQHGRQQHFKVGSSSKNIGRSQHHSGESSMSMGSVNNDNPEKKIKCYKCKQFGHYRNQCQSGNQQKQEIKKTHAFSAVFLNGNFSKHDFYLDSGASSHLVLDQNMMQNACFKPNIKEIIAANQSAMPVLCSGDVNIVTVTPNCKYEVTLKDVLCVPNLTTNLISISQLIKNGNKVEFKEKSCNVYNKHNELVAVADLVDGVYKLVMDYNHCMFTPSSSASCEVWHRRMGHLNVKDLNAMRDGAVTGLSYSDKSVIDKSTCTVCCEGKQSRLPFGHTGTRSTKVLDIIHGDVCGPMESTSIGGNRYFLILIDDYSRMAFVYFLKAKSEVFKYFKEFKAMVENQQNSKIKIFRSDGGMEFCSNEFESYMKEAGIIHQKTNAYTPEQNGSSERNIRTVVERARCLLFDANLDKMFWAEATSTAVYLRNRSVASGLNSKTPFELWTNTRPDLSHIRIFGSPVMVHVPKEKRLKWDTKSKRNILVGFSENVKGYRVYDPVKRCITTSRDVVIHEKVENCSDVRVSVSVGDTSQEKVSVSEEKQESAEKSEPEHLDLNLSVDSEYGNAESDLDTTLQQLQDVEEDQPPAEVLGKRVRRPPERYGFTNLCMSSNPECIGDPVTVHEALNSPDKALWIEAMKDELQAFQENQAWAPVDKLPSGKTLVQSKWVFKKKIESDKSVRYRARLVAKGFTQKPGIDYEETFSPVVRHSTLRLLFALSVQLNFDITHLDVKTAFLNGYLKEDIYMVQPDISCDNKEKVIVKLNRAIYGLKQSSRSWYERVEQRLCELGFKKCKLEPCVFTKMYNEVKVIIALYVDDFFVYSNSKEETEKLVSALSSSFKIKNLGQVQQCLGMRVKVDRNANVVTLDQEEYVEQLLERFSMLHCKGATTPMECKLNLEKCETCDKQIPYQQLIGCLLYLSVLTRPDIAFSVSFLSQFNKCHTNEHWNYAKRILRYLMKTKSFCLKYVKGKAELEGYVDADWASNVIDRKSYTGYCFLMSGSAVSWESKKQRTVALSSMESELMSIAEACKEAMYLRALLCEITGDLCTVPLYNDSQSAQKLVANNSCHRKSKHIDIRYYFVKDAVSDKIIHLAYMPTTSMPADILTKALCAIKHYKCVEAMGVGQC
jgi:transposase InsO family protein